MRLIKTQSRTEWTERWDTDENTYFVSVFKVGGGSNFYLTVFTPRGGDMVPVLRNAVFATKREAKDFALKTVGDLEFCLLAETEEMSRFYEKKEFFKRYDGKEN